jgi:hypothetical protein
VTVQAALVARSRIIGAVRAICRMQAYYVARYCLSSKWPGPPAQFEYGLMAWADVVDAEEMQPEGAVFSRIPGA